VPLVLNAGRPARPEPPSRAAAPSAATPVTPAADFAAAARAIHAVPGGVRLTFAPAAGVLRSLDRAVARARLDGTCLHFAVDAPPGGPVTLTITGPPGLGG
jgi:hypothetical protein